MTDEEAAEQEFKQLQAAQVAAMVAMDQIGATIRPFFEALASFEQGAVKAGLSYSVAAKLTVTMAETWGYPWLVKR